jgi:DNA polymerase-1
LFGNYVETADSSHVSKIENNTENYTSTDKNIDNTNHDYKLVNDEVSLKNLIDLLQKENEICFDTETTNIDANLANLVGLSFSVKPHEAFYVPCSADQNECLALLNEFKPIFENPAKKWIGQNIKYDLLVLKWYNIDIKGSFFDTMLAHYVIEPEGKRSMDLLSEKYLGYEPVHIEALICKKGKNQGNMRDVEIEKVKEYAGEDADITLQLKEKFAPQVIQLEVEKIFNEVECPLVKVLANMEFEGIKIDEQFLNHYSKDLELDAKKAEESV